MRTYSSLPTLNNIASNEYKFKRRENDFHQMNEDQSSINTEINKMNLDEDINQIDVLNSYVTVDHATEEMKEAPE